MAKKKVNFMFTDEQNRRTLKSLKSDIEILEIDLAPDKELLKSLSLRKKVIFLHHKIIDRVTVIIDELNLWEKSSKGFKGFKLFMQCCLSNRYHDYYGENDGKLPDDPFFKKYPPPVITDEDYRENKWFLEEVAKEFDFEKYLESHQ